MYLAIIIIRLRRLHSKPRNIFLLGIIFCNLLTLVPAFIEIIYWVLPVEFVCQSYVAVVGLPNNISLWNMLLALIYRYVAIQYPIWHREKVTVCRVIYFLLFSSVFLIFRQKFVFIFGFELIRCAMWSPMCHSSFHRLPTNKNNTSEKLQFSPFNGRKYRYANIFQTKENVQRSRWQPRECCC